MLSRKAQVSIEYMVIVVFGILVAGILWIYAYTNIESNKWDIEVAYAENAISQITNAADKVYIQGPPAKVYIYPNFPDGIKNINLSGSTVTFQLLWKNDTLRNISAMAVSNITGSLSVAPGTHKILVQAVESYVKVEET
ncbi:MAG: hypothetical protein HZB67_01930 [Candidatus Aenigmarchaeota archaeon]|nr:hypothetical protein [Candidatus Aenigmarchaeota archaeon]